MAKIKVLHIIGGLKAAGAETAVVNWLRTIDKKKYQFDFIVHMNDNFYSPEVRRLGSKIFHLPNPEKNIFAWIRSFEKHLSGHDYDIVHTHLFYFNGLVLKSAKKMGVSVRISHAHNEKSQVNSSLIKKLYQFYSKYLISKYATNLIGCSKGALANLYSNVASNDKRLEILHYGIDSKKFLSTVQKNELKRKHSLVPDKKVFLHIGRFAPVKNHQFLLEVFCRLIELEPNSLLVLIGEGKLKNKIEKMVKLRQLQEQVLFLGTTKNVSDWLKLSDVLIFPSIFEGLPVTLIEAQAAGLPCLISDTISVEIDSGIGLINFQSLKSDPKEWAKRALKLCLSKKLEREKILNAIKTNCFDIKLVSKKLSTIYERAVEKKS